jgi:hypothetical protein
MRRLSSLHCSLPLPHLPHGTSLLLLFITLTAQSLHGVVSVPRIRLSAMQV